MFDLGYLRLIFMPPTRKGAGGIMFSGCPSVRTGISLPQNLKNPWVDFYHTWPRGAPWRVDDDDSQHFFSTIFL